MDNSLKTLDETLRSLPEPNALPLALPPVHLSVARWFGEIIKARQLQPRTCRVFNEGLIYLFYGGVFYRTSNKPTRNAAELPVAFLFDPSVLISCCRYYPFDTGALATGLYGTAGDLLLPFEETYGVAGGDVVSPCRMVHHLYQTNHRYLKGRVNERLAEMPIPLPQLSAFFNEDLSESGIDQRQLVIECQSRDPLPLNQTLLWVGFPDCMTDLFAQLYDLTKPSMPEYFQYESHVIFNPSDVAAHLEKSAAKVIRRFEELPRAKGV